MGVLKKINMEIPLSQVCVYSFSVARQLSVRRREGAMDGEGTLTVYERPK
jgi:hypothetical protein